MITLFGATGYTGRLVAQRLAEQGFEFRLAGRSPKKLTRLADLLPTTPDTLMANAKQTATLAALCQNTDLLINCVGPFTDLGEAVVSRATRSGIRYLDTTNELGFVYRSQAYHALSQQTGAAIVPACGFEVALADCAAAVLAGELPTGETADELSVVYALSGRGSSFGSRRSAVRSLSTSWLEYANGDWNGAIPGRQTQRVELFGQTRNVLSFPSAETVTVPSHLSVRRVSTWMLISRGARFWAPTLIPLFAWLGRGPAGRLMPALATLYAPPPQSGLRSQDPFTIQVSLRHADQITTLSLTGRGVYDLTAEIIVYAAAQLLKPDFSLSGVLAPAAALDPEALLDHAITHWGIELKRDQTSS